MWRLLRIPLCTLSAWEKDIQDQDFEDFETPKSKVEHFMLTLTNEQNNEESSIKGLNIILFNNLMQEEKCE